MTQPRPKPARAPALCASLLACAAAEPAFAGYTLTPITAPGFTNIRLVSMNNAGSAVGTAQQGGTTVPVLWRGGKLIVLPAPAAGACGFSSDTSRVFQPVLINNRSAIIGLNPLASGFAVRLLAYSPATGYGDCFSSTNTLGTVPRALDDAGNLVVSLPQAHGGNDFLVRNVISKTTVQHSGADGYDIFNGRAAGWAWCSFLNTEPCSALFTTAGVTNLDPLARAKPPVAQAFTAAYALNGAGHIAGAIYGSLDPSSTTPQFFLSRGVGKKTLTFSFDGAGRVRTMRLNITDRVAVLDDYVASKRITVQTPTAQFQLGVWPANFSISLGGINASGHVLISVTDLVPVSTSYIATCTGADC